MPADNFPLPYDYDLRSFWFITKQLFRHKFDTQNGTSSSHIIQRQNRTYHHHITIFIQKNKQTVDDGDMSATTFLNLTLNCAFKLKCQTFRSSFANLFNLFIHSQFKLAFFNKIMLKSQFIYSIWKSLAKNHRWQKLFLVEKIGLF